MNSSNSLSKNQRHKPGLQRPKNNSESDRFTVQKLTLNPKDSTSKNKKKKGDDANDKSQYLKFNIQFNLFRK